MVIKQQRFFSIVLALILVVAGAHWVQAQPRVRAFTNARTMMIGDQVGLFLEVKPATQNDLIQWPVVTDSFSGLEVVERGPIDTIRARDTFLLRQRILVTGFDSGTYYIPSFAFQVSSGGQPGTYYTDSLPLSIQTIAVDTTKAFKPIKEIVAVEFSIWDYWQYILGGFLLLAVIVVLIIYFIRRNKKKPVVRTRVPLETAHDKALRMLRELGAQGLWEQGKSKEYFIQLSDIIRVYLEERFGITAMEQTTDELLNLLKKQTDAKAELRKVRPELKLILRTADLVKFAKANPLAHEHAACMAAAVEVVNRTTFKEGEGPA
ncbi:MAG: hypothetical protein EOP49_23395 [Sphingobacteriales bacterium]|nr:MAG: hypothetical protein EOP49_23395 [Sphingobacteriales bacterium]